MQNAPVTTVAHLSEEAVATDWAAEAEALAQRVTTKLREQTPRPQLVVVDDEYEPQSIDERKPSGRLTRS